MVYWFLYPVLSFSTVGAAAAQFDAAYYVVRAIELLAGAVNLILMGLNTRDGMKMSGRFRADLAAAR